MNDHAFYLWSSYGALTLAIVIELWLLARRRSQAFAIVRELQAQQSGDRQAPR